MKFTILHYDEIDSTSTEALNQAQKGAAEGLAVVARRQTAGRGRHGRIWVSEKDAGLYFSFVLRPQIEAKFLPLITLTAAIAVSDALENIYKIDCDIKWVNDVHVRGKKIGGILAETAHTLKGLAVVVGIGVNLKSANFPPELSETATSVEAETGEAPDAEVLLHKLTGFLSHFCELLGGAGGAEIIRREWIKRSSYAFGKLVRARLENEIITGKTCGIEENGALRIELETGEIRVVSAGEIEKLRAD